MKLLATIMADDYDENMLLLLILVFQMLKLINYVTTHLNYYR